MDPVTKAIESAGGVSKLAAVLGLGQSVVSNWKARGKVPAEKCVAVETATGVSRYELRPDVFGGGPETNNDACQPSEPEDRHRRTAAAEGNPAAQADEVAVQTLKAA